MMLVLLECELRGERRNESDTNNVVTRNRENSRCCGQNELIEFVVVIEQGQLLMSCHQLQLQTLVLDAMTNSKYYVNKTGHLVKPKAEYKGQGN